MSVTAPRGTLVPFGNPLSGVYDRDYSIYRPPPDPNAHRESLMPDYDDVDFSVPSRKKPAPGASPKNGTKTLDKSGNDNGDGRRKVVFAFTATQKLENPSDLDSLKEKSEKSKFRAKIRDKFRGFSCPNIFKLVSLWKHDIREWKEDVKAARIARRTEAVRGRILDARLTRTWDTELQAMDPHAPRGKLKPRPAPTSKLAQGRGGRGVERVENYDAWINSMHQPSQKY